MKRELDFCVLRQLLAGLIILSCAWPSPRSAHAAEACPAAPPTEQCWTTEHVIHSQIDHHAQSALFRMFTRGGADAADASAILYAVRCGQLEGVYLPDQQVPALRAQAAGSGWWQMIPPGELAACYKQPSDATPLIVFRKQIKDQTDVLASGLRRAWKSCGIPASVPRCYTATISRPADEGGPGTERLIIDLLGLDGGSFPYEAKVSVVDLDVPVEGSGGLKIGKGSVEYALQTNANYAVVGQSMPPGSGDWNCGIGPHQEVRMEAGVTLQITLKVPACIPATGGL